MNRSTPVAGIRTLAASRLGRQSMHYFLAQLANAALGIVVYGLLARLLSVEDFGRYSFVISIVLFASAFFDFGAASSGMRLAAVTEDAGRQRANAGLLFGVALLLGLLFAVALAGLSFGVAPLYGSEAGRLLLLTAPLMVFYPLQEMVISFAQGSNRMSLLSLQQVLPRVLLIAALVALPALVAMSTMRALAVTFLGIAVSALAIAAVNRPLFRNWPAVLPAFRGELREFGRQVYVGRMVDGLTAGADRLLIAWFSGMAPLAMYSVAVTMTMPIGMMSRAMSGSAYRSFAGSDRIPRTLLAANAVWCIGGSVALLIACEYLIPLFFTASYERSLAVLPYLAAGGALAGLNMPFHAFLAARRQGRAIRVMSVTTSTVNVVANIALVPLFSVVGAGIAMICSYGLNIVMNLHYYRLVTRTASAGGGLQQTAEPAPTERFRKDDDA